MTQRMVQNADRYHRDPLPFERFMEHVQRGADGECWPWLGVITAQGYGVTTVVGQRAMAHRYAYLLCVGPIPAGLVVDHVCHNRDASCPAGRACMHRRCVNPLHLQPVTDAVNLKRGRARLQMASVRDIIHVVSG